MILKESWLQDFNEPLLVRRLKVMKRILVIALGLGIALGTVSFAQDSGTDTAKKMTKKKKKKGTDTTTPPASK
jgi:hypothetical protein